MRIASKAKTGANEESTGDSFESNDILPSASDRAVSKYNGTANPIRPLRVRPAGESMGAQRHSTNNLTADSRLLANQLEYLVGK